MTMPRNNIWPRVHHELPMAIDELHVDLLYDLLQWGFHKALEIGSHKGSSTCAFLESVLNGSVKEFHIAEPEVLPELQQVVQGIDHTLHNTIGVEVLRRIHDFDLVFVDGNHSYEATRPEVEQLLRHGTPTILAHDTNSTAIGVPWCEGPYYLKEVFACHPDYYWLEDSKRRDGMQTSRGFFYATRDRDQWQYAKAVFRRYQS